MQNGGKIFYGRERCQWKIRGNKMARKISRQEIHATPVKIFFWPVHQWEILSTETFVVRIFFLCWDLSLWHWQFSQNFTFFYCPPKLFFCFIFFVVLEMSPRCLSWWLFRRSWNPVDSNWRSWDYWAAVLSTRPQSACWENSFGTSRYIVRFRNLDRKFSKSKPSPVSNCYWCS